MVIDDRDFRVINGSERRLLQAALDRFLSTAEWPLVAELQHALARSGDDLDVAGVAAGVSRVLAQFDLTSVDGRATLTIHGVSVCEGGEQVLGDLLCLVRSEYVRWLDQGVNATLTSDEFAEACGADDIRVRRVRALMDRLPGWMSISGGPDRPWTVTIGMAIRQLKDIQTVEQLLGALPLPGFPASTWPYESAVVEAPVHPALAEPPAPPRRRSVFISVAEGHKRSLAHPLRDLLEANGVEVRIVSDLPRPGGAWTPEDKVVAYLEGSDAMVAIVTGDLLDDAGRLHPRPNIADEIGRARATAGLRDRICVLKEHAAQLPSNIAPVYEQLDAGDPGAAFDAALAQLREWGFAIPDPPRRPAEAAISPELADGITMIDGLSVTDPARTYRRVLEWLEGRSSSERAALALLMVSVALNAPQWEDRSVASHAVERMAALEIGLLPDSVVDELSRHRDSSVRSSAAVILYDRAVRAPGLVPMPLVARLVDSTGDAAPAESWYVYTPARACLAQLALSRPEAWDVVLAMAGSPSAEMREGAAGVVARIAERLPAAVPLDILEALEQDPDEGVRTAVAPARAPVSAVDERQRHAVYAAFAAF